MIRVKDEVLRKHIKSGKPIPIDQIEASAVTVQELSGVPQLLLYGLTISGALGDAVTRDETSEAKKPRYWYALIKTLAVLSELPSLEKKED